MIKTIIVTFYVILCVDTISSQSTSLCEKLVEIYDADRNQKRLSSDRRSDNLRLKTVSQIYNDFGLPYDLCEEKALEAIKLAYWHASSYELKELAFPIIYGLYQNGFISDLDMIESYLRVVYQYRFSDFGKISKIISVEEMIQKLNIKTKGPIDIDKIDEAIEKYDYIRNNKSSLGVWKSERKHEDFFLRIFTVDNNFYFEKFRTRVPPTQSIKLNKQIETGKTTYTIANDDEQSYLSFKKRVLYETVNGKVIGTYFFHKRK